MRKVVNVLVVVAACAALVRVPAHAQEQPNMVERRRLLEQAIVAERERDHRRALDLAQRAFQIRATASVALFMAEQRNALGELVEALNNAQTCLRDLQGEPPRNRPIVERRCRMLRAQLDARIVRVMLRVPAERPPNYRVRINDQVVRPELYNSVIPVSPGRVVIVADVDGTEVTRQETTAAEGGSIQSELTLPRRRDQ